VRQDNYTTFQTILEAILLQEKNGFRTGRTCTDNVLTIKQTIEKRREFNLETHIAFLDLEKAFDRVNRNQLWQIFNKRCMPYHLIDVIKSLYKIPVYKLTRGGKFLMKYILNKEYDNGVIYHRLFNVFIDVLLRNWKHKADTGIKLKRNIYLNTLLFADDQEDKLQKSVYLLNQISKDYNLIMSTNKTKIMTFKQYT